MIDRRTRRVVTANDADGRSYVESDALVPPGPPVAGRVRAVLWRTDEAPARTDAPDPTRAGAEASVPVPGSGGTLAILVDVPPREEIPQLTLAELRGRGLHATPDRHARHPLFHATDTLDYCLCIEGESHVLLDEGEIHLRAGDVLVQRGTQHAWDNRSGRPCRMLFVLVDARPLPQRS